MIGVTGAGGYLGRRIVDHLRSLGIDTVAFTRAPMPGDPQSVHYQLGEVVDRASLEGISAIVHTAHDFTDRSAKGQSINTLGVVPLLRAAREATVRVVLISSLSAYEGCQSNYGQAKLELERMVFSDGGAVLRPGVIFGRTAGGIFQSLAIAVARHRIIPLPSGGLQPLYVSYDQSVCELAAAVALGDTAVGSKRPVLAAHDEPTTLFDISRDIAGALSRSITPVPVPWRLGYWTLAGLEKTRLRLPFSSDSLIALARPVPIDQIVQLDRSEIKFPRLSDQLWN